MKPLIEDVHAYVPVKFQASDPSSDPAATDPDMEPGTESVPEIAAPAAPLETPSETFRCEKCGATFTDAGAATAHIQTCKGAVVPAEEGKEGKQSS